MKRLVLVSLSIGVMFGVSERAIAHGVEIEYQSTQAIQITASFDTGEPMADAQVAVFSPESPSEPWLTGTTNEQGQFVFAPDYAISGNWDVQVRQAGHGDIISVPIADSATTQTSAATGGGFSMLQKVVMVGAVIWGFVGTALYFMPRKS